ncbi:MAG: hypothetical protein K0R83_1446 [Caulobacter sp.]|jgi:hypothetical protein|nr:hypothetical protein [Caulobacter sp.]
MRSGLILLLLGLPGAALAAEDRYGPSRSPAIAPIAAATVAPPAVVPPTDYRGRLLTWSGKPAAPVAAPVAAAPAPVPVVATPAPPPRLYASRAPEPARLPTSLYDAPAPAPVVQPALPPAPVAAAPPITVPPPVAAPVVAPPAPTPPAVWPQAVAAPSLPPPPSAPPAAGAPNYGYSPPRAYSVVREWGGTPDRIPSPPQAFSGREVALDPLTLGAPQQPDPPAEDEMDEEQPAPKKPAKDARK